jgi:hypothetical protein
VKRKEKREIIYVNSSLNMILVHWQTSTNSAVRPSLTLDSDDPPVGILKSDIREGD